MTWTPEQKGHRDQWALDAMDDDPRNLATIDPMDAVMRRRTATAEPAPTNGHVLLDADGLPMPGDDVPLMGQAEDRTVDIGSISMEPAPPMLIDRLDPLGHTILYGTGGVGKGSLAAWWIALLVRTGHRVLIIDYEAHPEEWGRRLHSLAPDVYAGGAVRHVTPTAPIHAAAADIAWACDHHGLDYIVVDSAVMACGTDPLKPEAAALYSSGIIAIGRPALTLAHVTKLDDSRYPFGSVFWHNLARMTWSMTGDDGEVLLKHRKHNNYDGLGTFALTVTWDDGRLREVWERGYNMTILDRALDALPDGGLSLGDLQSAINDGEHRPVNRDNLRRTLAKAVPLRVRIDDGRYFRA